MTMQNAEDLRFDQLTDMVHAHFADTSQEQVQAICSCYEESILEMFDVISIENDKVKLQDCFYDRVYEPVIFPEEIVPFLKEDDCFLLTLARHEDEWHVIFMSPPYYSEYVEYQ